MNMSRAKSHKTIILPEDHPRFFLHWFLEIYDARSVLYALVVRDVKVRYKHTLLGVLWVVLQPVAMLAIFHAVFSNIYQNADYLIYAMAGLVAWQWISFATTHAAQSLDRESNLITKIYFPRVIVPLASVLSASIDFTISLVVLVLLIVMKLGSINVSGLSMLFGILTTFLLSASVGCLLSYLNVLFKDVRYALPFLTQVWFFATPIVYPLSSVPRSILPAMQCNPAIIPIEFLRSALLPGYEIKYDLSLAWIVMFAIFAMGLVVFKKTEFMLAEKV